MLQFDQDTQAILENAYAGGDITRRRMASFAALDPRPGDRILDLGCGQGLLSMSLARAVGPDGFVTGVDPTQAMRDTAQAATAGFPNISILDGDAGSVPLPDESQDRAVSLQVFEYVPDARAGLRELHRVLRPGGWAVIGDMHWESVVWYSADPDRMRAVLSAWDAHLTDPALPTRLPKLMRETGFDDIRCEPLTFLDTVLRPDGLASMLLVLIEAYLRERALLPEAEITAWVEEQRSLSESGAFFFSLLHVVTTARRV